MVGIAKGKLGLGGQTCEFLKVKELCLIVSLQCQFWYFACWLIMHFCRTDKG